MTARARVRRAVLAVAASASLAACHPHLYAESAAPPGRVARLDEVTGFWDVKSYTLELSAGTAVAISCASAGPCRHAAMTSDAPAVVDVRPASLDVLRPSGLHGNSAPATAFVVIGRAAGTTHLHLRSDDGARDIAVEVVAPPVPAAAHAAD